MPSPYSPPSAKPPKQEEVDPLYTSGERFVGGLSRNPIYNTSVRDFLSPRAAEKLLGPTEHPKISKDEPPTHPDALQS